MDLSIDGRTVHAATGSRAIHPDEPAVVLVHGAGMDRTVWQLQTRNIANMGRRAFAVDLPGHGRSDGPLLETIGDMADWIGAFLDAAGIEKCKLIGHSMGALTALEAAARFPDRLDGLCLMGVAESMPVHPDLLAAAEKNEPLVPELIVYWGLGDQAQVGGHPHPGLWIHGASRTLLDLSGPGVLHNDLKACNEYGGAVEAAAKVTCPTLFVLGRGDKMTPTKKAKPLADIIDGSVAEVIDNCGHMMMTERPREVYNALKGFV